MAIEDNKVYGLTGAQLKELPGKIEAVKGLAKELTEDDYNWPTDNPSSIALWLLEPGLYTWSRSICSNVRPSANDNSLDYEAALVVPDGAGSGYVTVVQLGSIGATGTHGNNAQMASRVVKENGILISKRSLSYDIADNLTTNRGFESLSARQGKVLKDLIDALDGSLAAVAKSGSYNDLTDKPDISGNIGTAVSSEETARQQADAGLQTQITDLDASLSTVAKSGSYDDLTDKPDIAGDINTAVTSAVSSEASARQTADEGLQAQIDAISASSDVVDLVGTKAELDAYNTSVLGDNDIIKVLSDETQGNATAYYKWHKSASRFESIGTEGPFYTKSEADTLLNAKANASDVYTKTQMDTNLNAKANTSDMETALAAKANSADVYTKSQTDTKLNTKANSADVYTKAQTDTKLNSYATTSAMNTALADKANSADVYTKTQVDSKVTDLNTAISGKADAPASGTSYVTDIALSTALASKANAADLAKVATSGSYADLSNKPTIPTVNNATLTIQKNGSTVKTFTANASSNVTANITVPTKVSELTNDSSYATTTALAGKANTADLAKVATSGSYTDLANKPTIPTVNNATLTIQKNGTTVQTFTANASANKTANIEVPVITLQTTDPGEGATLAANNFIAVYEA